MADRQTGGQAEERLGAGRLFPEDVSGGLGRCTGVEEPGGQEGRFIVGST